MFERIRDLIDYVQNAAKIGDSILHDAQEVLAFVRQYFVQAPIDNTPPTLRSGKSKDEFETLRAWCDESESQGDRAPKGAMPVWLLPILLRLIEEAIAKFTKDKPKTA